MDQRQLRTVETFERVLLYLDHEKVEPVPPLLTEKRDQLAESIVRLRELSHRHRPQPRARSRDLSQRLRRERMLPLARLMRRMLAYAPGVEKVLRVPHARADAMTIATAAIEMAKFLEPHRELLVSAGMAANSVEQLRQDAELLGASLQGGDAARDERSRVTREIAKEMKSAMATLGIIDALVLNQFTGSPVMQKHWKARRKVGKRMGRPPQKRKRT